MKSRTRLHTVTLATEEKKCYILKENLIEQLFIFWSLLEGTIQTS